MKTFVHTLLVGFGDCDPAGIVYYPNFFRWFDATAHVMFAAVGCDWRGTKRERNWIVGPIVDAHAAFRAPATHGDTLEVHASVSQWSAKSFRVDYRIVRGPVLIAEGWEVRIVAEPHPDDPSRIRALPLPDAFRALFD